jgi:SPASM domain peptide maturase of grasp-with-spasm system
MENKDLYLIPISSCLYTTGYTRTLILNIHQRETKYIPNILHHILISHKHWKKQDILDFYPPEHQDTIKEYFDFLNENRLIYWGTKDEIELFPDYNYEWDFPASISNAIIEINNQNEIDYKNLIDQLDDILCFYIQLRFFNETNEGFTKKFIEYCNSKSFRSINLSFDYTKIKKKTIIELINTFPKINKIVLYSAPKDRIKKFEDLSALILETKQPFGNHNICGTINPNGFSLQIEHFTESLNYNTCLNRKLCIDSNGYIKNCPSMKEHYGHISEVNLKEVIEKDEFKKYWFIKKDDIDVCQDCEFRHICTDCRAFIKDQNNICSQPSKCSYNPYIAKWQGQEDWINVEQWRNENHSWEAYAKEIRNINNE